MEKYVANTIIRAINKPLLDKKLYTYDMAPNGPKVDYRIGPSATTFYFSPVNTNDVEKILKLNKAITTSVAQAMNMPQGKTLKARIVANGAYIEVEIARQKRWLPCWPDVRRKVENSLFVGFDSSNNVVHLDLFSETSPGLFAIGSSGSGKTNLVRLLLNQLREKGIKYYLVDLKGGKDWRYDLAHFAEDYAFDEVKAEQITEKIFRIMQERNRTNATHEPLVFVFDEVTEASEELQRTLGRISKLCRSANIRLIFGAQRVGEDLDNEIKGNLKRRIVGWVSSTDAFNATGVKQSGAQFLEMKGDMLVCHPYGTKRVQVPRANQADLGLNLGDVEEPKKPIIDVKPSAKPVAQKVQKDDKTYLIEVLPIEKRRDFFKWIEPAIKALNQSLIEIGGNKIDHKILFFSAHMALKRGKPVTIKMIDEELKRLKITGAPARKKQKIRWFGGAVTGDEKSLKQLKKLYGVT